MSQRFKKKIQAEAGLDAIGVLTKSGIAVVLANDPKLVVDGPSFEGHVRTLDTVPNSAMPGDSTLDAIAGSNAAGASVYLANQRIVSLANPTAAQDAATKSYVDTAKAVNVSAAGPAPRVGELLWVDIDDPAGGTPVSVVTSLPASPGDGQEVYYNFVAQQVVWHLRYNASAGYWDFLGGAPFYTEVSGQASTVATHTLYQDLSGSPGPSLTIPLKGSYDLTFSATLGTAAVLGNAAYMSFDATAAGGAAAGDASAALISTPAAAVMNATVMRKYNTGYLNTLGAIVAKFRSSTANAITGQRRTLEIIPRWVV